MSNYLLLLQLLLQHASKVQEIGEMFRNAQGGNVTDEQVNASTLSRDVAIAKAQAVVDAAPPTALT